MARIFWGWLQFLWHREKREATVWTLLLHNKVEYLVIALAYFSYWNDRLLQLTFSNFFNVKFVDFFQKSTIVRMLPRSSFYSTLSHEKNTSVYWKWILVRIEMTILLLILWHFLLQDEYYVRFISSWLSSQLRSMSLGYIQNLSIIFFCCPLCV